MNRLCPICSCSDKTVLFEQEFYPTSLCLMNGYKVVACDNCGFCFADGIPTQAEFSSYYEQMTKYDRNHADCYPSRDQLTHYTKIFHEIEPYLGNKEVNILDIGCSIGGLLSVFQKNGYERLLGIEPSGSCVETVKRLYGIEAQAIYLSDLEGERKFDLAVLSEVLEHIVDLNEVLAKINDILSKNGLLFIEVPDSGKWEFQNSAPFQQFSVEHINYFSQCSLGNLLTKNGFETVAVLQKDYVSEKIIEPVIMILARKRIGDKDNPAIQKDTVQPLRNYVDKCLDIDKKVKASIHDALSNIDKVIVWGVGTHTLRLLGQGLDVSKIKYFVDSNTRYIGKTIDGLGIKAPEDIQDMEAPILISTFFYQEEITNQIRNTLHLKNPIITIY